MRRYIVGRLLLMIPTLIGVAILTFVIMRAVPGDIVALRYAGSSVPQEVIDQERHILGLDKPMTRSEEHTSELQSLTNLVCRLLLEKKKKKTNIKDRYTKKTTSNTIINKYR